MMMFETVEQSGAEAVTPETVQARVDDWSVRIARLYLSLKGWLPDGYSSDEKQSVVMDEEMMREHGIGSRELPVLNIYDPVGWAAKIIPYGLWIIGANGRLDAIVRESRLSLVGGIAEYGEPDWFISERTDRFKLKVLNQQTWLETLS